jgi:hypothetical protein
MRILELMALAESIFALGMIIYLAYSGFKDRK